MKQTSVRERRKFDETFKREAVQNWLHSGKSAEVVGEELGLNANLLYAWRELVPAIAGGRATAAKPGQTLTCNPGSWSNGTTFAYQFGAFTDSDTIALTGSGAANTYAVQPGDVGSDIFCEAKVSNGGGYGYGDSDTLLVTAAASGGTPATGGGPVIHVFDGRTGASAEAASK